MPVDLPASGAALARPGAPQASDRPGPAALYRERIESGRIRADPEQERVIAQLEILHEALRANRRAGRSGLRARFGRDRRAPPPRGIYLWGPVGRGKSMLMDCFFAAAPIAEKRRVHFHAFMLEVHERIEAERRARSRAPVARVAAAFAAEARLLCFDEFQVNDIADAMIMERLFRALIDAGTTVVATSNRPPDRLYEGGLQRERFLPFIALLEERLDPLRLDSGRDYRMARLTDKRVYHWPLGAAAHEALEAAFAELTEDMPGRSERLVVKKRELVVPRAARGVAWFSFADLCGRPLAAADYIALAERYAAIVLEGIPRLSPARRNEAQRLHVLVDTLYEARTLLVASAEATPEEIYTVGDGAFEFRRTVSRLHEMQSEDYLANRTQR